MPLKLCLRKIKGFHPPPYSFWPAGPHPGPILASSAPPHASIPPRPWPMSLSGSAPAGPAQQRLGRALLSHPQPRPARQRYSQPSTGGPHSSVTLLQGHLLPRDARSPAHHRRGSTAHRPRLPTHDHAGCAAAPPVGCACPLADRAWLAAPPSPHPHPGRSSTHNGSAAISSAPCTVPLFHQLQPSTSSKPWPPPEHPCRS